MVRKKGYKRPVAADKALVHLGAQKPMCMQNTLGAKHDISAGDNGEQVPPTAMKNNGEAKYMVMLYKAKDVATIRGKLGPSGKLCHSLP